MSDLTQIPPIPDTWPTDRDVTTDYMAAVVDAITNHPRSLQKRIGPSEIGTPCARKLGYKLAGKPERPQKPNWKATIGTGGHLWQEEAFDRANLVWNQAHGNHGVERWLLEEHVTIGNDLHGEPITGSCDLYDRVTRTVIDHKFVGKTQLAKYRSNGPSPTYRVQAHSYGVGWAHAGFPVDQVAIAFLPRDGELADAHIWTEPFNPGIAAAALQRLHGIQAALALLGDQAYTQMPTADDYCTFCPFYLPNSADLTQGCPGHPGNPATTQEPALTLNA